MKTNKLPRKSKFDAGLTIAGWVLAVFVSFLYLHEVTGSQATPEAPTSAVNLNLETSERIQNLLTEARAAMISRQPEVAINRVTTIWSVCSASHQEVPEETHHIFARCVSQMAERDRNQAPPPPPPQGFPPPERPFHPALETEGAPPPPPLSAASSPVDSKDKTKPAEFKLPQSGYPKAKQRPPADRPVPPQVTSSRVEDGPDDIPVYSPDGHPPFPPRMSDRRGQQSHQPPGMNRPGNGFPGNRPGSFPPPPPGSGQFPPHPPLDSQDGGRPPGY